MATVSVRNISKIYPGAKGGEIVAVNDLNFEIADGEFVVLAGPSGCGKSTTLRAILGLEKISQGEIFIGGRPVNDLAPKDRDVAMVFQNEALYPHLTVFDNLAFGLKLRKYSRAEIKKRVMDAASILGIESLLERKPKTLSPDQRQRVALARAIVRQPKVFLFDEPLSNLEARMRVEMRAEIVKLHQRLQTTTICTAQDSIDAMTMADRIVVMNEGVVQQNDAPLVLYNEPANLFVAGFFGTPPMNFIAGTLKDEGDRIRFREIEGGTIDVAFAAADRPAARGWNGKSIILGIRPEDLEVARFSRKEGKALGSAFPALAEMVEPMGAETNLHLQTGAHTLVCRTREALDRGESGHRFQFTMKLEKAHLFDPASTKRLV